MAFYRKKRSYRRSFGRRSYGYRRRAYGRRTFRRYRPTRRFRIACQRY